MLDNASMYCIVHSCAKNGVTKKFRHAESRLAESAFLSFRKFRAQKMNYGSVRFDSEYNCRTIELTGDANQRSKETSSSVGALGLFHFYCPVIDTG